MPFTKLNIKDFLYNLPDNKIALYPIEKREQSKLLIYDKGSIKDEIFYNIIPHLTANNLLIFNKTKVVNARLLFQKETSGVVEIFCLEPVLPTSEISQALMQTNKVVWKCFIGGAKKWKQGKLSMNFNGTILSALKLNATDDAFLVEFEWDNPQFTFGEILQNLGNIPLPPYIKRKAEKTDESRYQTVYANEDGSVAAPTAGLHFTKEIIKQIESKNITNLNTDYITLHVGAGTFKPVSTAISQHKMHAEHFTVSLKTLQNIKDFYLNGLVTAVGTTSLRTLESIYWIGVNIINKKINPWLITQFQPYEPQVLIDTKDAVIAIENYLIQNKKDFVDATTSLMIVPGYKFRIVKELITNFHQPGSTLLLLVSAFIGEEWKVVYQHALDGGYRFLSYGDACYFKHQSR